ncbi:benzoate/H(+) symporter BenE family transporter [Nakamurella sp. YIM 132087]|uniref:Benzoate/H(+) symporter BenE family transporter n=1 Tax=Nakamurella alba TaxID=2665158 RepID=A0A7K1FKT4_9ACTN|nr:benzoate/H(+) symporter BenE family transporter [Nakamurella alba]
MAGAVTAVVGFTSSFAVVLTGLAAVGASAQQAASGLLVLCLTMGLGSLLFSWKLRMPVTMAWSTPGAALLAAGSTPEGGFSTAVSGFLLAGILIALCGLVRPLGRLVELIPGPLAQAMLAGVLLLLCTQPITAAAHSPAAILPVLATWLLLMRFARRWAVPGAFAVAVVVMVVSGTFSRIDPTHLAPQLTLISPGWDPAGIVAIGVPLFLVTMTSQNIPGMAVLATYGYRPKLGPALLYTGVATAAGAPTGAHAINLAAISAALSAGPGAGPDRDRRWIAGVTCGLLYLVVLGPASAAAVALTQAAPDGIMAAIAGLALIATFASAAAGALADPGMRDAAAITFLVAASGLTIGGIGAAFWALVAGGLYLLVTHRRAAPPTPPAPAAPPGPDSTD